MNTAFDCPTRVIAEHQDCGCPFLYVQATGQLRPDQAIHLPTAQLPPPHSYRLRRIAYVFARAATGFMRMHASPRKWWNAAAPANVGRPGQRALLQGRGGGAGGVGAKIFFRNRSRHRVRTTYGVPIGKLIEGGS